MSTSTEIFDRIAADIGVFRYRGESELSFCARVSYSASRFWVAAFCADDGDDGKTGISKQGINRRLKSWLEKLEEVEPGITDWFDVDNGGIAAIYNRLIDVEDIEVNGFSNTYVATKARTVAITEDAGLLVGFFDPTAARDPDVHVMSGLVSLADGMQCGPIGSPRRWWEEDLDLLSWEPASNFGEVLYADFRCARWNISRTDVWLETPTWVDNMTLASTPPSDIGARSFFVARKGRRRIEVSPIDWPKAQDLFFRLRESIGNRALTRCMPLDEDHVKAIVPIGFVPGNYSRYLDALGWPAEKSTDRFSRVFRVEALPLVEKLLALCSIGMKGM